MTERYWIDDFLVDVSRNQITYNESAQTLPPKALAVLTYLARYPRKVVSQEELLIEVWKDTIVTPNTLQRCIAQLRKALGDDGKAQGLIKTHAKKGYSLEANVCWENTTQSETQAQAVDASTEIPLRSSGISPMALALLITVLLISALIIFSPPSRPAKEFKVNDIRLLTSTDNRELASTYSPDGKFIVFQRFPEVMCTSQLWAKNIETQQETQLTTELGSYGSLTFSPDGKFLTFVEQNGCTAPVEQRNCFELQTLNFEQALQSPQTPTTLLECENTEIKKPIWISSDEIALMQKQHGRWKLIAYSVNKDNSIPLFELNNGSIVSFDFSHKEGLIALTSVHENGDIFIEKLTSKGELLSSNAIDYQGAIPKFNFVYPNFSSDDEQLIFSTGKQLFTLNFDGEINRINMPLTDAIGTPTFHPSGRKMLAIKGYYDSDIVSISLSQFARSQLTEDNETTISAIEYLPTVRSALEENSGKFQPSGDFIVFSSQGDGTSQVWTASEPQQNFELRNNVKQLSHFPVNTYVTNIIWDGDGKSVLVNASSELKRIDLDGSIQDIKLPYPVRSLFHWNNDKQTALANILHQGVVKFVEIDLVQGNFSLLSYREVQWAAQYGSDGVIYTDLMGRFWKTGSIEHELIPPLVEQGSDKNFIVVGEFIYGINNHFQLWRYDFLTRQFNVLGQLPDTVDYITDGNEIALLVTMRIAARKDVVELALE